MSIIENIINYVVDYFMDKFIRTQNGPFFTDDEIES